MSKAFHEIRDPIHVSSIWIRTREECSIPGRSNGCVKLPNSVSRISCTPPRHISGLSILWG